MKFYISLLIIINHSFNLCAQVNSYTINGTIRNVTSGKIFLHSSNFDKGYYGKNHLLDSADIYEGKFKITRQIYDRNPHAYRFVIQSDSLGGETGLVFIGSKDQNIIIDSINEYIAPIIKESNIQKEMKLEYEEFFKDFVRKVEDLNNYSDALYEKYEKEIPTEELLNFAIKSKEILTTGDSLFFEYAKKHPNSYVTLWKLIERFNNYGYIDEYFQIYRLLSYRIKNTSTAKLLEIKLSNAKGLGLNNLFPRLKLKDSSHTTTNLDVKNYKAKYILIDFWFSNCGPCLRQFPKYKKLYNIYKSKGFEIIGISVDNKRDLKNWEKAIEKNQLIWTQYLDEDGRVSRKMNINFFPTNFLLDKKGVIVKKNIAPEELENLLIEN